MGVSLSARRWSQLQLWSIGVLEYWSIGVLEFWSFGVLEFWSFGALEFWSFGVVEFWSFEVLEFWSFGVLKFELSILSVRTVQTLVKGSGAISQQTCTQVGHNHSIFESIFGCFSLPTVG